MKALNADITKMTVDLDPFFVLFCFVLDEISVHPPTHTHTLIVLRCTFPPLWLVSHAEIHVSMT